MVLAGLGGGIVDLAPMLGDFSDTAAAVSALDLVISADTSVAHLAGALGRPVWMMLPYSLDWRWLTQREDSPWYPDHAVTSSARASRMGHRPEPSADRARTGRRRRACALCYRSVAELVYGPGDASDGDCHSLPRQPSIQRGAFFAWARGSWGRLSSASAWPVRCPSVPPQDRSDRH